MHRASPPLVSHYYPLLTAMSRAVKSSTNRSKLTRYTDDRQPYWRGA